MKSKPGYFTQYIYFSALFSVGQERLKNIAIPNDYGGSKTGFDRWTRENGKALKEGELTRQNTNSAFNGSLCFRVSPVIHLLQTCMAWLKPFLLTFDTDMHFPPLQLSEVTIAKLPSDYFNCNRNDRSLY